MIKAIRDSKGRFIKGNKGFWLGKKRPNLINTGAIKTMIKKGERLSPQTEFKQGIRNNIIGEFKKGQFANEQHPFWKGDSVGYYALHLWISRHYGKAKKCEFCGKTTGRIDWANKTYEYKRDRDNWLELCHKCHMHYDMRNGWGSRKERFSL